MCRYLKKGEKCPTCLRRSFLLQPEIGNVIIVMNVTMPVESIAGSAQSREAPNLTHNVRPHRKVGFLFPLEYKHT
jgi:hypothetical protein